MAGPTFQLLCLVTLMPGVAHLATSPVINVRAPCAAALGRLCAMDRRDAFDCAPCGGHNLPQLRNAGCNNEQIAAWCGGAEPTAKPALSTVVQPVSPTPPSTVYYAAPAPRGLASNTGQSVLAPTTLAAALYSTRLIDEDDNGKRVVQLDQGTYTLEQSLVVPSRVSIVGSRTGPTILDGGVTIHGWEQEVGRKWLFSAPLSAILRGGVTRQSEPWGAKVHQLWVGGQRRGVARSPTMTMARHRRPGFPSDWVRYEGNVTSTGFIAQPGQLMARYNTTTLRCVTYQHWTAIPRMVINNGATSRGAIVALNKTNEIVFGCGHCQFCPAGMRSECSTPTFTGDGSSNGRYYLEDAPE